MRLTNAKEQQQEPTQVHCGASLSMRGSEVTVAIDSAADLPRMWSYSCRLSNPHVPMFSFEVKKRYYVDGRGCHVGPDLARLAGRFPMRPAGSRTSARFLNCWKGRGANSKTHLMQKVHEGSITG